jgi:hypothetical protein
MVPGLTLPEALDRVLSHVVVHIRSGLLNSDRVIGANNRSHSPTSMPWKLENVYRLKVNLRRIRPHIRDTRTDPHWSTHG